MKPPSLKTWAILDSTGLLVDYRQSARKPRSACVDVSAGCDLALRRYRWTGERFDPVEADEAALGADPGTVHAFALGFAGLHNGGIDLHPVTVAWLQRYAQSLDNKVPDDRRVVLTR